MCHARSLPGYASSCEAYGGFRYINGYADRAPVRPNISLGDTLAGLHAAFGVAMALLHRQRGGGGQVVDASIAESMFNMLEGCVTEFAAKGLVREPSGSTVSGVVPSGTWRTADGHWVVIGGNGDSVYTRLMAAVGRPDMGASNPLYASDARRWEREQEICEAIDTWVAAHTMDEVLAALGKARVPSGPILSIADIVSEEQYVARNAFHKARAMPQGDEYVLPAMFPVLSKTPGNTQWAGPGLGEHTSTVLRDELGFDENAIAALREKGVI